MSENLSRLAGRPGWPTVLLDALAADVPLAEMEEKFYIPAAPLLGAKSFYDFLNHDHQTRKINLCNGSACLTAGTQYPLFSQLSHYFKPDDIGTITCLGRCHTGSALNYAGKNFCIKTPSDLDRVIHDPIQSEAAEVIQTGHYGRSILYNEKKHTDYYPYEYTQLIQQPPEHWLEHIKQSGLRGRGGAGFPLWLKLNTCQQTPSEVKYVVVNADEGDPGAYSDRLLLEQYPDTILQGMVIAGYLSGARYGMLYVRGEYPEAITILRERILAWQQHHRLGSTFDVRVVEGRGSYVCGEETALLASIEGRRPEVSVRPPYPAVAGLYQKPTVVCNVETIASLPFIIRHGGEAFSYIGRAPSTGTKLISLDSHFHAPGVYEVEMGTPLRTVLEDLGQGFKHRIKALHIGGPLGGLVPVHKIDHLEVTFESFKQQGFELGHASVVAIPESFPMIQYLEHLFAFTAHESCGKCVPCRLGAQRGYEMLAQAIQKLHMLDRPLFLDLLDTMQHGSLCALGGGLPLPIRNALHYFEEELAPYFKH